MPKDLTRMTKSSISFNTGKYIGYTEGNKGNPTLYFSKGHITQYHDNKECVGWNPTDKRQVLLRNINPNGVTAFNKCFDGDKMNIQKFSRFSEKVKEFEFDTSQNENKRLLSYTEDATFTHLSRSFLVKKESKQCLYHEKYANSILKNTRLSKVSESRRMSKIKKGTVTKRCSIM